jgi:hypothetical protein
MAYLEIRTSMTWGYLLYLFEQYEYIFILGSTMKNSLSTAKPTGKNEWHGQNKREYVVIEAMSALIKVYGTKGEGNHKDPTKMKNLKYEYADKMLNHEPLLAE